MSSTLREDGGLLVLGNLRQATEVHICMTERDARAPWRVYRHKKKGVVVVAAPYAEELAHLATPRGAKKFAWPPNEARKPFWGQAVNQDN